ncbi:hypothetical protein CMUS01_16454 [Colletotrichum musicola]|uniref:Uncharacterized protein n=1 Tax=Colletotrichum musicola TaxID=2175873 RepID=A0A8H6INN3_9PEZI|nr:hypothetical protein CMUS01_16454 [Colletotrichum musicola]
MGMATRLIKSWPVSTTPRGFRLARVIQEIGTATASLTHKSSTQRRSALMSESKTAESEGVAGGPGEITVGTGGYLFGF